VNNFFVFFFCFFENSDCLVNKKKRNETKFNIPPNTIPKNKTKNKKKQK